MASRGLGDVTTNFFFFSFSAFLSGFAAGVGDGKSEAKPASFETMFLCFQRVLFFFSAPLAIKIGSYMREAGH